MFIWKNLKNLIMSSIILTAAASSLEATAQENIHLRIEREILSLIPKDHFFPAQAIKAFLKGYSDEDLQLIFEDFFELKESVFQKADRRPLFLVTAGSPCAGKSTLLERYLEKSDVHYAYIDPDRVCLFHMTRTYVADRNKGKTPLEAYNHWRGASNFISNTLMAFALSEGYATALGSTMTSPYSYKAFQGVRGYGYKEHILHVSCPDDLRVASEKKRRDSGVVQCDEDDLRAKGVMFYQRLDDYLKHADTMEIYYRGGMDSYVLAATWKDGSMQVLDKEAYPHIVGLHDKAQGDGDWEKNIKIASEK